MVETIGKRLTQARLAKGLTIDEAAHVTKMRPDKILALENDDYGRFGNNAYAKGFLQIYGRFLGVDTSEQFRELETTARISVNDYQYLNNAPEPPKSQIRTQRQAGPPSIIPLLVVMATFVLIAFGFWIYVKYQQIGGATTRSGATATGSGSPDHEVPVQGTEAVGKTPAAASPIPARAPEQVRPAPRLTQENAAMVASNVPKPAENVEVRRAEAVQPVTANVKPRSSPEAITPAGVVNEVVVEPIKKTWVKIRRGTPDSQPIFEDYLYPNAPPLKLRGTKFFVEVRDQSAVQILKNGTPIAYQAPGISIQ